MTTLDQEIARYLNEFKIGDWPIGNFILVLIALLLSVILCGLVGIEREKRGRSAGLRTHLLVGVGSCIIMIISIYGFPSSTGRDVARLAAQIITGVGFLGAGAIIHRNSGIKGLTTAATIWIVMAIGIACGSFNFLIAIISTVVILFVLVTFRKVEAKLNKRPVVILTAPSNEPLLEKILKVSKEFDCSIHGLSTDLVEEDGDKSIECTFQVEFSGDDSRLNEYLSRLEVETKVASIKLLNNHR